MSEPNIVSNFGRPAVRKNILSCRPASPVFFRVTMAGNKFVFRQENLLLYLGFSILLKAECESQCNVRCVGKDSSEGWRDRLDGGVREANAEIQPGSYFGRFDTLGDSDHLNSDELVSWTGMRHTASRNACRPGAITKERNRVASDFRRNSSPQYLHLMRVHQSASIRWFVLSESLCAGCEEKPNSHLAHHR